MLDISIVEVNLHDVHELSELGEDKDLMAGLNELGQHAI